MPDKLEWETLVASPSRFTGWPEAARDALCCECARPQVGAAFTSHVVFVPRPAPPKFDAFDTARKPQSNFTGLDGLRKEGADHA